MGGCPIDGWWLLLLVAVVGRVPNAVVISHSRNAACRAIDVCLVSNVVVIVAVVL